MSRMMRWTCNSLFALFVGVALTFGATQAFATTTLVDCERTEPEFIGSCPPYTDATCDEDCRNNHNFEGGSCVGPCCVCFI